MENKLNKSFVRALELDRCSIEAVTGNELIFSKNYRLYSLPITKEILNKNIVEYYRERIKEVM